MKTIAHTSTAAFQPLYRQIKTLITESLVSGEWRQGDLIPSEIELAGRFSVSQGTVRKAIGELTHQNLLVRQQGKGTFVASHSEERNKFPYLRITPDRGAIDRVEATLIDCRKVKLDATAGKKLGLAAGAGAFVITRVMSISGKKAIYEEIRLPATRFRGLSAETMSCLCCVERCAGIPHCSWLLATLASVRRGWWARQRAGCACGSAAAR